MTEETQDQAAVEELDIDKESVTEPEAEEAQATDQEAEQEEGEEAAEVDELAALSAELEEVKTQAAEYLDGWQRARAEFANFRRRQEQRQKQMNTEAKSRVLSHLLPAVDDLERALGAVPQEIEEHAWVCGLSLVLHKLTQSLERDGLSVLEVEAGSSFDPNYHEALTHEPNEDYDEGTIIQVVQRGYMLDEVVLRPALVRVSSGKLQGDETKEDQTAIIDSIEGE
jgi:molecular chaperone GrpE